jgi:hypothetical protein
MSDGHLLIEQTFSQKVWPKAGDIDDCWVVATLQCANAVAPWLPLLDVTEFRAFAGDPDNGVDDGGNVDDIMKGITAAWPELVKGCTAVRGWTWERVLTEIKGGRPFDACVISARLPVNYGFLKAHQVTLFQEPGVGLHICNPLAPDRSEPPRIATASAQAACEAYGNGKVYGVLFPTVETAFKTHPLYLPPSEAKYTEVQYQAGIKAAEITATAPLNNRIKTIKSKVAALAVDIADD